MSNIVVLCILASQPIVKWPKADRLSEKTFLNLVWVSWMTRLSVSNVFDNHLNGCGIVPQLLTVCFKSVVSGCSSRKTQAPAPHGPGFP